MLYSDGKILIDQYNNLKELQEAAEKISDYMIDEKGLEVELELHEHEKYHWPYFKIPREVKPLDIDAALRPRVALRAINDDTFQMFEPLKVSVKHIFNEKELSEMGFDASTKYIEMKRLEAKKKQIMADYKARIEALDGEIEDLASKQENGYEMRDYEAVVKYNFPEGVKYFFHANQPDTILKTEKMDPKDYQLKIEHTDEYNPPPPEEEDEQQGGEAEGPHDQDTDDQHEPDVEGDEIEYLEKNAGDIPI